MDLPMGMSQLAGGVTEYFKWYQLLGLVFLIVLIVFWTMYHKRQM